MTIRGHRLLPHTADTGLEARGPDLATTLEEAGFALAGLTADIAPEALLELGGDGPALPAMSRVLLEARDLAALAFAWLDELVGRVDVDGALAAIAVETVEERTAPTGHLDSTEPPSAIALPGTGATAEGTWHLRARVATLPFDGVRVRRRADVKAATYHGLEVVAEPDGGWRLTAYLDI